MMTKFSTSSNDVYFPYCSASYHHYNDVIMGAVASQITSLTIVYSTVDSDAGHRKHQSSASLAFVWRIHRGPVNSPRKWPVTRKMFPFDDVIMIACVFWKLLYAIIPLVHVIPNGWMSSGRGNNSTMCVLKISVMFTCSVSAIYPHDKRYTQRLLVSDFQTNSDDMKQFEKLKPEHLQIYSSAKYWWVRSKGDAFTEFISKRVSNQHGVIFRSQVPHWESPIVMFETPGLIIYPRHLPQRGELKIKQPCTT